MKTKHIILIIVLVSAVVLASGFVRRMFIFKPDLDKVSEEITGKMTFRNVDEAHKDFYRLDRNSEVYILFSKVKNPKKGWSLLKENYICPNTGGHPIDKNIRYGKNKVDSERFCGRYYFAVRRSGNFGTKYYGPFYNGNLSIKDCEDSKLRDACFFIVSTFEGSDESCKKIQDEFWRKKCVQVVKLKKGESKENLEYLYPTGVKNINIEIGSCDEKKQQANIKVSWSPSSFIYNTNTEINANHQNEIYKLYVRRFIPDKDYPKGGDSVLLKVNDADFLTLDENETEISITISGENFGACNDRYRLMMLSQKYNFISSPNIKSFSF